MKSLRPFFLWLPAVLLAFMPLSASAKSSFVWAAEFYNHYNTIPNLTYKVVGGRELKLDVYQRNDLPGPVPTLFFVHGGGWQRQTPADVLGNILPWLEMGWTVVNIDYRLTQVAPAPAAVEDCLAALHWVAKNAPTYHFDLNRLVIGGASAGGQLALMTALAPADAGLDPLAGEGPLPKAAAVVSLSGVTDLPAFIAFADRPALVTDWLGKAPNRDERARRFSPITYVRPGLPPILTTHGDADPTVPYASAVRFHAALTKAGVPNQLFTIRGGKHGAFTPAENLKISETIRDFLAAHGLKAP